MTLEELDKIISLFQQQHLLVIGDLMIDRYVLGNVGRLSPEAPVLVFPQSSSHDRLGGAGNVVRTIKGLGGQASFIGVVGEDSEASLASTLFTQLEIGTCHLLSDKKRPTSLKTRYISQNQQIIRIDREESNPISQPFEADILSKARSLIPGINGIILSDYAKGVLTPTLTQALIDLGNQYALPVFVDPKTKSFEKYRGASWITPNRRELEEAAHFPVTDAEAVGSACLHLIKEYKLKGILATRSEQGMSVIYDKQVHHLPTKVVDVFDVSGAGDTVLGTFALGITAGLEPLAAADLSNHAAGVVVGKSGTATITPNELRHHKMTISSLPDSKLCKASEIQSRLFDWRCHGLKIGFTNGCFDILHPGHIYLLKQAKSRCDRLIVGLNTDLSIKRLKGPDRPIHNFFHRSYVLEGLEAVDMIIGFEEDTPLNLILSLQPDVLFKGADYQLEEVVGGREIISWGGKVELLTTLPSYSTTATVNKLKLSA